MSAMSQSIGYDQTALRNAVDVAAAARRLRQLGRERSLAAVSERAWLLESIGRLDDALVAANEAVTLARASGSRDRVAEARLLRASVIQTRGDLDAALRECTALIAESRANDWVELWAHALQQRGTVHFALRQWHEACLDFTVAVELCREAGLEAAQLEAAEIALMVATDRAQTEALRAEQDVPRARHPLWGGR
ncbi:hypothetical protein SAMN04489719_1836 [Agrococcus carbonis]|uniref:Tetratricopeptide repeat-containing protein n=2 Tax=Agrococcus carbonis TaxID=684552 RepID=A0A1H1QIQ4_9MICO|nr:hypothetical protein SAMN04489719_1836 [Agrococcus carbonis]